MEQEAVKKLSKTDLVKSFLCWHNFAQSCYNYERMQALGMTHAMIPVIKKLYSDQAQRAAALKRHLVFFNTEANLGSIVPGIMAAMEEERANGKEISDETLNSLKTGLMGPLAGVGDTLTQGLVKTVLLAFCVDLAAKGSIMGPILFFILFTAYTLGLGYFMYMQGYKLGKQALLQLISGEQMKKVTEGLKALGLIVVGALAATRIPVATGLVIPVGQSAIKVQELLNHIMPSLLSFLTLLVVWLFLRRGTSISKILTGMFVVGFAGVFLGVLQ